MANKQRTKRLNPTYSRALKALFTPKKAMDLLSLDQEGISYDAIRRAMNQEELTSEESRTIELAWESWAVKFLKDGTDRTVFKRLAS